MTLGEDNCGRREILIVDEESMAALSILTKEGYEVHVAAPAGKPPGGGELRRRRDDIKMPGEIDGPGVLSGVKKIDPRFVVIRRRSRRRSPRSRR
jgi:hypothetical protein